MAQHACVEIAPPFMRIVQGAVGRLCDGVDGQVAPPQVFDQRHPRAEFDGEAAVAGSGFTFQAGQRIFFVGDGVQEHREVASHFPVAEPQQFLARGADHHPVPFLDGQPEQGIPNRAADQIHLHR